MDNAIIDPADMTAKAYIWFGVFNSRYRLVAVEQAEYSAGEIAERMSKADGPHHVVPVYVEVM